MLGLTAVLLTCDDANTALDSRHRERNGGARRETTILGAHQRTAEAVLRDHDAVAASEESGALPLPSFARAPQRTATPCGRTPTATSNGTSATVSVSVPSLAMLNTCSTFPCDTVGSVVSRWLSTNRYLPSGETDSS